MALLGELVDLLDLRLGLEGEVLGASAPEDQDAAPAAAALGVVDDGGGLVDVQLGIEADLESLEAQRRQPHAEAGISGAGGVDRHAGLEGGAEKRAVGGAQQLLPLAHVPAQPPVQLGGRHALLELLRFQHLGDEIVGLEKHLGVENDVVDPDDPFLAEGHVVNVRGNAVQGEAQRTMDVVIEVRPGGDDPVDEARLDERDEGGVAEARRGQGAARS